MPWYGNANPATPVPKGNVPNAGAQENGTPGAMNSSGTQGFGTPAGAGPSYVPDQNLWGSHLDYGENYIDTSPYAGRDPSNFWNLPQFGGMYGASNRIAAAYGNQGDEYANRVIGNELSNPYRMQQGEARGLQQGALAMQMQAAAGQVPSSALIGQGLGMSAAQEQAARAAAAGGNPAFAQMAAMRAGGQAQLGAAQQGAMGRAGEIAQANQGWIGQTGNIRAGDYGAFNIDNAREMQQAELNQKMQLGSQGMGNQILLDQLGVDSQGYGARLGVSTQNAIDAANRNFQTQKDLVNAGVQGASGLLNAYGSSSDSNKRGQ